MTTTSNSRAAYISGLRRLADLLAQHNELPLPYEGSQDHPAQRLTFYFLADPRAAFIEAARLLPGPLGKEVTDDTYRVVAHLDGLHVQAVAYRDDVCERVVIGTREVTKTIPDPSVTVPTVTVTETVEDVEWRCTSLLAEEPAR